MENTYPMFTQLKSRLFPSKLNPLVADKAEVLEVTAQVLEHLHTVLSKSYGSLGENTIVFQSPGSVPIVTKDGLNILRSTSFGNDADRFDGRLSRDIYQLITSVSASLVNKVGDGSTSAVISSRNAFKQLLPELDKFPSAKDFTTCLQDVQMLIEDTINLFLKRTLSGDSSEERKRILSLIAGISNNNDFDIGGKVADIMASLTADSVIKILENPADNSPPVTHTLAYGFPADDYRVAHAAYFTGNNKSGFEVKNPFIFMSYEFLDAHYKFLLEKVIPMMTVNPLPIVVIAETVQIEVQNQIVKDAFLAVAADKTPQIILMTASSLQSSHAVTKFMDLAVYLKCDPALANSLPEDLSPNQVMGHANKITILPTGKNNFEAGAGMRNHTEEYQKLLDGIMAELDNTGANLRIQRGELRNRLNRLNGVNATIYVGGRTNEEKENLKYLVEDSVLACQSVIRNGYTIGGNAAPLYAIELLLKYIPIALHVKTTAKDEKLKAYAEKIDNASAEWRPWKLLSILNALHTAYTDTVRLPITMYKLDSVPEYNVQLSFESDKGLEPVFFTENMDHAIELPIFNTKTMHMEHFYAENITPLEPIKRKDEINVLAPVSTDIEILRATFSILGLILTSNQYLVQ